MTTPVIHHPRVAWDMARATLAMAWSDMNYEWFAGHLEQQLGPAARQEFDRTRDRLIRDERPDVHQVELGRWRVRFEDALSVEPSLGASLTHLHTEAAARR
jgi:hypothetical protein